MQTLAACDPDEQYSDTAGKISGFSLHAGVVARADERKKLEHLCRYISRLAVSEKPLSILVGGAPDMITICMVVNLAKAAWIVEQICSLMILKDNNPPSHKGFGGTNK